MPYHVKDGGVWKEGQAKWVKDGGVWKEVQDGWIKDAGIWKPYYSSNALIYGIQDTQAFSTVITSSISTSASLGTAHSDREIWVIVLSFVDPGANPTIVTVQSVILGGGNTTTKVFAEDSALYNSAIGISFFKYLDNGNLGASTSVDVMFDKSQYHVGLAIVTSSPTSNLFDSYGSNREGGLAPSGSINTTTSGWALGVASTQNGTSGGSIPNFGNDVVFEYGSKEWAAIGYNSPASGFNTSVDNYTNPGTGTNTIAAICME